LEDCCVVKSFFFKFESDESNVFGFGEEEDDDDEDEDEEADDDEEDNPIDPPPLQIAAVVFVVIDGAEIGGIVVVNSGAV
jgi:hypothetical protein